MPNPAVGTMVVVTMQGLLNGQTCENVLHYYCPTTGAAPANIQGAIAAALSTSVLTPLALLQGTDFEWKAITTQTNTPADSFSTMQNNYSIKGDNASPSMPAEVCCVIQKLSGFIGKKRRGRLYVSGFTIADYNNTTGLWLDAFLAAVATAASLLINPITEPVSSLVFSPVITNKTFTTNTQITTINTNRAPRAQRRRQFAVGI